MAVQGHPLPRSGHACSAPPSRDAALLLLSSWMVQQSIDGAPCCHCCQSGSPPPRGSPGTRSTRCFVAAALKPQTRAFIDFLVEAIGKAALTATGPPGETLKTQTPGAGAGVWKMRVATATAQRDFRPSGSGRAPSP